MTCIVHLVRHKDNKILKILHISEDTYPLCEEKVKMMNGKLKNDDKKHYLTTINV
jgi:hypothetical protein